MNIARMRASSIVLVVTLMGGFASTAVHGQTVQGTPADEQAIRESCCLARLGVAARTTSRGWSWAYTLTPIRVVPTAAS